MTKLKAKCLAYYSIMALINIMPFIPMSIKGILGLFFIIISCVKLSYRHGLITSTVWVVFGFINFSLGVNVDYKHPFIDMTMGTSIYYFTAYYIGNFSESLKCKNNELMTEIELRQGVEKELKEKLTIIQSLMDTIPSPIFFKDLDLKYLGSNKAFEEYIGVESENIKGKTTFDITEKELATLETNKDIEILEDSQKGMQVYDGKVKIADGSIRDVIFNKAVYKDVIGNSIGIVGVITDITYKKERDKLIQTVEEKKVMIDEILEIDKLKTEFFANISHELRTPLNVILGANQLMERYSKENKYNINDEKVINNINTTKQNCYRLLRLVNNLIDITRVDACAFEINLRNLNIVNIVEEITLSVAEYIENKGISLTFDTEIEELIVACDEDKIERIMLNLLSNAVKFTPKEGGIFVTISSTEEFVFIKVIDTGIGIPDDKQGKIFTRFSQVDDLFCRRNEGSGIGLNLVKALVEMHGGSITLRSKLGVGTTFTIKLPITTVVTDTICNQFLSDRDCVERINIEFSDIYFNKY